MRRIVAVLAPAFNVVQMMPQLVTIYRVNNTIGLSLAMLALSLTANVLWTIHGCFRKDWSLVFAGSVASLVNFLIIEKYLRIERSKA